MIVMGITVIGSMHCRAEGRQSRSHCGNAADRGRGSPVWRWGGVDGQERWGQGLALPGPPGVHPSPAAAAYGGLHVKVVTI